MDLERSISEVDGAISELIVKADVLRKRLDKLSSVDRTKKNSDIVSIKSDICQMREGEAKRIVERTISTYETASHMSSAIKTLDREQV